LKSVKCIVFSFVNLSSFHYKHDNQNKLDSTVKKKQDLSCLSTGGFMNKERSCYNVSFLEA